MQSSESGTLWLSDENVDLSRVKGSHGAENFFQISDLKNYSRFMENNKKQRPHVNMRFWIYYD